jgi:glycosyltransferase involved in cell wall biosynthesis
VRGLDVQVDVVLGGVDTSKPELARLVGDDLPPNVVIHTTCSKSELLELYARSMFVVIPTQDVDFAAGSTALKEAMSLGKATIMTKARGQVDYIKHGDNGLTVPPGDPAALREAITHLMHHPEEAERIGRAARKAVKARFTMGIYVERLASLWGGAEATVLDTDQLRTERHIVS